MKQRKIQSPPKYDNITPEIAKRVVKAVMDKHDKVNHPIHYNSHPAHCPCGRRIECIDITRHMDFNIGNVIKYLWRATYKNGVEDLKKAQWYLNDAIKMSNGSKVQ